MARVDSSATIGDLDRWQLEIDAKREAIAAL
jgi:hypothetical protein